MKTRFYTFLVALLTIVTSAHGWVNTQVTDAGWCVRVTACTNRINAVKAIKQFDELDPTGTTINKLLSNVPCVVLKGAELVDAQQLLFLLTQAEAEAEVVVPINEKNFGGGQWDTVFVRFLSENYDNDDNDGFISYDELASITKLDISEVGMTRVNGLKYFFNLAELDCTHCHNIYTLDTSANHLLRTIRCSRNYMTNDSGSSFGAQKLVDNLPEIDGATGNIYYYDNSQGDEKNEMTPEQVTAAQTKNWRVLRYNATTGQWEDFIQQGIEVSKANFPDDVFRSYVQNDFDIDKNGFLSQAEIDAVKKISVSYKKIANLTGVGYFTKLENLNAAGCMFSSLDLSANTALVYLDCSGNNLTQLSVVKNTKLTSLLCYENKLTSLDLSKNAALEELNCGFNNLTKLDVSKNTKLKRLTCHGNLLTSLDISHNTQLNTLAVCFNHIRARAMYEIVKNLPSAGGEMFVPMAKSITDDGRSITEENVLTKQLATIAFLSGWAPCILDFMAEDETNSIMPYTGSNPDRVMSYTMSDGEVSLMTASPEERDLYYGILNGLFLLGELQAADEIAPYYNKNGKLLFTLSMVNAYTVKVTVAPGVTAADNIHHVLTDDERITLYTRGYDNQDYFDVKQIDLKFGSGVATAISNVQDAATAAPTRYNLSGQRVDSHYRGIVIENGRKRVAR